MPNYSYNGNIYPELKWDNVTYPYVYISNDSYITAYAFAEPLSDVTESIVGYSTYARQPFMRARLKSDENNREYWGEWEYVTEDDMVFLYTTDWTNHNVLMADGSIFLSASEPSPVTYPIVIFEGEEEPYDSGNGYFTQILVGASYTFATGDRVKITLNGVSGEYVVKKDPAVTGAVFIGNAAVSYDDAEDDGGDWLFTNPYTSGNSSFRSIYFYTRTEGTYQIKIELLAPEPTLTARDLYRKINGQPTKLTLYKKVSGELVALDEYSAVLATAVQSNT